MNEWSEGTLASKEAVYFGSFHFALLISATPIRQI
jgi:hypothetical protein